MPPEYARLSREATRLPLAFRFESGSNTLDSKALRDIGRLVERLSRPESRGQGVMLFGFADAVGGPDLNRRLSTDRANAVRTELMAEGVDPLDVVGFGSAMPVASNATDEGRARNRRVEVWLR